jgi:CHAT domain-containing protein/tetratricopeptide (TPR) repeat protein
MTAPVLLLALALRAGGEVEATLDAEPGARVTATFVAESAGPVTLSVRSIAVDVAVVVREGDAEVARDDNGAGGTDSRVGFAARAGVPYTIEIVAADRTEGGSGPIRIEVRPGEPESLEGAQRAAADDAYWERVRLAGEERGDPWLRFRARRGLASADYERGSYPAAYAHALEAVSIAGAAWGETSGRYGVALADAAVLGYTAGLPREVLPAAERAVPILENAYGPTDARLAVALNTLGLVRAEMFDLPGAREAFERSVAVRGAVHGERSEEVALALNNLATVLDDGGDFEGSLAIYRKSLAIFEERSGPASRRVATALNNVGFALRALGRPQEAETYYRRALEVRERLLGPEHPLTALSLQNLGVALHEAGRSDEAEPLLRRALAIREARLGPDHPHVALTLSNLAEVLAARGRLAEALPLQERALAIRRAKLGRAHPDVASDLVELSAILAASGRVGEAFDRAVEAESIRRDHLRAMARFLPERAALRYAARRPRGVDAVLHAATREGAPADAARRAWNEVIRSRAIVLDENARRLRSLRAAADPAATQARERVQRAVEAWAKLASAGAPDGTDLASALEAADLERERAERALVAASAAYRRESEGRSAGFAEVSRAIPDGDALIGFVRHGGEYAAFAVRRGGTPSLVSLGAAAAVEVALDRWRKAVLDAAVSDVGRAIELERRARTAGEELRATVWDPLAPLVSGALTVHIVADGALHLLPFDALPAGGGRYLVETTPPIHYLATERDLLDRRPEAPTRGSLLAFGGPTFDDAVSGPGSDEVYRGGTATCEGFRSMSFAALPGAAAEAADVARTVGRGSRVLRGAKASEEAFKRLAPGSEALHLATHGFVLDERCGRFADLPLRLSGLALAGANLRARVRPKADDGILTAEEIATLDLSRVGWVALSACDTGGGGVAAGEGVLGLRRAFAAAGAGTLVLSAWPVEDRDARRWMKAVYTARFVKGAGVAEATRAASLEVLRERRERGLDTGPARWGGFVAER